MLIYTGTMSRIPYTERCVRIYSWNDTYERYMRLAHVRWLVDELRSGRQSVSDRNGIRKHVKSPWVTSPRSRFSSCLAYCVDLQHSPKNDAISTTIFPSRKNWSSQDNSIYIRKNSYTALRSFPSKVSKFNIFYIQRRKREYANTFHF